MPTEFNTQKVMVKKERLSRNFEQLVENDLSLPDYCGDIVKILSCNTDVNIYSASVNGDSAVVDGSVITRILYTDSSAKTEIYEMQTPFNRSIDAKGATEADIVEVTAVSQQVSCRAVNQRRCDVRGSVTLRISITGCDEVQLVTQVPDGFCHTLTSPVSGNLIKLMCRRCFTITESSEAEDRFRNTKIVRAAPSPVITEVRTIKNKMMIRGNANTDVTLLDSSGNFITARVQLPVNQIIELEGIDEDTLCNTALSVTAADVRLSHEAASPPHIELTVTMCAIIEVTEKTEFDILSEAYAPHYELLCSNKDIKIISDICRINETHAVSVNFDFSSCKPADAYDIFVKKIRYTAVTENKAVVMRGNIHLGILIKTQEGDKLCFERIADFEHRFAHVCDCDEADFRAEVIPLAAEASVDRDGTVTVHTEFRIDGRIFCMKEYNAVSSIEKSQEMHKATEDSIFTVYFASEGESLWNIAKEHNTSTDRIRSTNPDITDVAEKNCMLVFEQE